jgi:hypothetical protein
VCLFKLVSFRFSVISSSTRLICWALQQWIDLTKIKKKVRGRLLLQEKSDAEDTQEEEEEDEEEEEEEETPTPAAAAAPNGYKASFRKFL